jgi:hypothetical protein
MMCDKDLIVSYLYDELTAPERASLERHLRGCAECRDELDGLRGLRTALTAWTPPQPDLAFQIVDRHEPARATWRPWWTPAFGLAAAAVLLLAVASALAHLEVRYGADGFSVRTGWDRTPVAAPVTAPVTTAAASPLPSAEAQQLADQYAAMEQRIQDLERARSTAPSPVRTVAASTPARTSDTAILRQVHDLLAQSESRQQQELALRIAQVMRDVDAQRTADLARIQQGLGRIDAMTAAEATAHQDLAKYLLTSARQQK